MDYRVIGDARDGQGEWRLTRLTLVYWHLVEMQDDLHKAERANANNTTKT
jgi:hypothetical protein